MPRRMVIDGSSGCGGGTRFTFCRTLAVRKPHIGRKSCNPAWEPVSTLALAPAGILDEESVGIFDVGPVCILGEGLVDKLALEPACILALELVGKIVWGPVCTLASEFGCRLPQ